MNQTDIGPVRNQSAVYLKEKIMKKDFQLLSELIISC